MALFIMASTLGGVIAKTRQYRFAEAAKAVRRFRENGEISWR